MTETTTTGLAQHVDELQFFESGHLPDHLREVSEPFGALAHKMVETLPDNIQRRLALWDLLRAKDAAVRARLAK